MVDGSRYITFSSTANDVQFLMLFYIFFCLELQSYKELSRRTDSHKINA